MHVSYRYNHLYSPITGSQKQLGNKAFIYMYTRLRPGIATPLVVVG